jgi:hypothetical protein
MFASLIRNIGTDSVVDCEAIVGAQLGGWEMSGRFQATEAGFILEGQVCPVALGESSVCNVSGAEPDGQWKTSTERSLLDVLEAYKGRNVRITVEVVEQRPVDILRELIERFREEAETLQIEPFI